MADLVGMRVRDRVTGVVTVDISDRLTRIIGVVNSGSANGSITVPGFVNGDGWVATLEAPETNSSQSALFSYPRGTISGTTLSWDFPAPSGGLSYSIVPCDLMYGVY